MYGHPAKQRLPDASVSPSSKFSANTQASTRHSSTGKVRPLTDSIPLDAADTSSAVIHCVHRITDNLGNNATCHSELGPKADAEWLVISWFWNRCKLHCCWRLMVCTLQRNEQTDCGLQEAAFLFWIQITASYNLDCRTIPCQGMLELHYIHVDNAGPYRILNFWFDYTEEGESQWPRGITRRSADARLLGLRVRMPPGAWICLLWVLCVVR